MRFRFLAGRFRVGVFSCFFFFLEILNIIWGLRPDKYIYTCGFASFILLNYDPSAMMRCSERFFKRFLLIFLIFV